MKFVAEVSKASSCIAHKNSKRGSASASTSKTNTVSSTDSLTIQSRKWWEFKKAAVNNTLKTLNSASEMSKALSQLRESSSHKESVKKSEFCQDQSMVKLIRHLTAKQLVSTRQSNKISKLSIP